MNWFFTILWVVFSVHTSNCSGVSYDDRGNNLGSKNGEVKSRGYYGGFGYPYLPLFEPLSILAVLGFLAFLIQTFHAMYQQHNHGLVGGLLNNVLPGTHRALSESLQNDEVLKAIEFHKKSESKKLRACLKKEEKIRNQAAKQAVAIANSIPDPLADFPAFKRFDNSKINVNLECKNVDQLDEKTLNRIFCLERENMKEMYNSCSWGWDEEKKFAEMTEKTAKYLIARDNIGEIVAFAHFRFDMDYGSEVLYCYELQLDSKVRRKGLGKLLLQVLELMAFKNKMKKVVLTVLNHNTNALKFFLSMRYTLDETSPAINIYSDVPYQILSKVNRKFVT